LGWLKKLVALWADNKGLKMAEKTLKDREHYKALQIRPSSKI